MINVDNFLSIGKQHKVCEDYIISNSKPIPYVILSDGCSSSKDTDMGARIICHLAKQFIKYRRLEDISGIVPTDTYEKLGSWVIHNAENIARGMGLDKTCLDATLIVLFSIGEKAYVYVYGDGLVIYIDNKNVKKFYEISYSNNAPYYLSYLIDPFRDDLYYDMKNYKSIIFNKIEGNVKEEDNSRYDNPTSFIFSLEEYSHILISSDGLGSFINKNNFEREDLSLIINEFTLFKNTKGEFIKRRSKKALKDIEAQNSDDISIGGFYIEN